MENLLSQQHTTTHNNTQQHTTAHHSTPQHTTPQHTTPHHNNTTHQHTTHQQPPHHNQYPTATSQQHTTHSAVRKTIQVPHHQTSRPHPSSRPPSSPSPPPHPPDFRNNEDNVGLHVDHLNHGPRRFCLHRKVCYNVVQHHPNWSFVSCSNKQALALVTCSSTVCGASQTEIVIEIHAQKHRRVGLVNGPLDLECPLSSSSLSL